MTSRAAILTALVAVAALVGCGDPDRSRVPSHAAQPPNPMATSYLQGAVRMARDGNLEGALEAVERARRTAPDAPDVYMVKGQVLVAARDFASATEALERAVSLDPSDPRAWEMLGHARFQSRQFRDAIAAYEVALEHETTPFLWQGIGSAYQELFRPDSAAMAYRRVLQIDTTFAPAWAALSEIAEDEGELEEALRRVEHASVLAPRSVAYQFIRARILVRLNREDEGIPLLREIVQRDTTHYGALYNLGLAYRQVGRLDEAQVVLEQAARLRDRMTERKPL